MESGAKITRNRTFNTAGDWKYESLLPPLDCLNFFFLMLKFYYTFELITLNFKMHNLSFSDKPKNKLP